MNAVKSFFLLSFVSVTASSFAVTGPCDVKEPHNAFFASGEFLYWRPDQTGMTYAMAVNAFNTPLGSKNKAIHQSSDWGPGFRVGAGALFNKVPCDLSFYWTRFHHNVHSASSRPLIIGTQLLAAGNAFPIGGSGVGGGEPSSNWHLDFDTAEFDIGYRLCFNKRYQLRPYLGVTGGWINQKQVIKYENFVGTNNALFSGTIKQVNDFHGVGPKIGLQGDFAIGAGFGILGNLSTSLFYGKSHNPVTTTIVGDPADFPYPLTKVNYSQYRIIPSLQAQVGFTWEVVCTKHFTIDIGALYEAQYFWGTWRNQNSVIQNIYIADAGYGNLMLQGGTWELKFTF